MYDNQRVNQTPEERLHLLKTASWIGICGNFILAGMKIIAGMLSGSFALIGDGIDSLSDVITSIVILYAATVGAAPPDPEHPWGHGRLEIIATKTLSLLMIVAGLQILILTIRRLMDADMTGIPGRIGLYAIGVSIVGKACLAVYKFRVSKITESQMIATYAQNMLNDILLSVLVLAGILFTRVFHLPVIDLLTGFGVCVWIVTSGIRIFLRTNSELMDSMDNPQVYREVFAAVEVIEGVFNPHRVRIRGINAFYVIDLDVEVDGNLSVNQAHELACELEAEIRKRVKKVFDIMVHIEPIGGGHHQEGYGLIPSDIRKPAKFKT